MDRFLGAILQALQSRASPAAGNAYSGALTHHDAPRRRRALAIYGGLIGLTYLGFKAVPAGFIPEQDKQYLVAVAQLPPAASLERTEAVTRRIAADRTQAAGRRPRGGVRGHVGQRLHPELQRRHSSFFALDDFAQRSASHLSGRAIAAALNAKLAGIQDAFVMVVTPPPVIGLGHPRRLQAAGGGSHRRRSRGAFQRALGRPRQAPPRTRRSAAPSAPTRSTSRSSTSTSIASR